MGFSQIPNLGAMGSNPVGRTKFSMTCLCFQGKKSSSSAIWASDRHQTNLFRSCHWLAHCLFSGGQLAQSRFFVTPAADVSLSSTPPGGRAERRVIVTDCFREKFFLKFKNWSRLANRLIGRLPAASAAYACPTLFNLACSHCSPVNPGCEAS